jgi:hypothetical protein
VVLGGFFVTGWLRLGPTDGLDPSVEDSVDSTKSPAIYALPVRDQDTMRNPAAVRRATAFLEELQPQGSYILTSPGVDAVVPMDLAHAAIALTKVGRVDRARAAVLWLDARMTTASTRAVPSLEVTDYLGSWYDSYSANGQPNTEDRGRGEAVGMALIATHTVWASDPSFLSERVGELKVSDLVRLSVRYLTQPAMAASGGGFAHSPTYTVAFNEECARMAVGLRLAGEMLRAAGDDMTANVADFASDRGISALRTSTGLSQGMAYDYYAMGIWGLGTRSDARFEVSMAKSTGLVGVNGVRNWDWQLTKATSLVTWLRWWAQSQTIAPSETFDFAIASISAGDVRTAVELERRWLPRQRSDGSFADAYVFGLRLGISRPTSYAVSRFLLLESLLTAVSAPQ